MRRLPLLWPPPDGPISMRATTSASRSSSVLHNPTNKEALTPQHFPIDRSGARRGDLAFEIDRSCNFFLLFHLRMVDIDMRICYTNYVV